MEKINHDKIAEIVRHRIEFIKTAITKKYQEPSLAVMKLLAEDLSDYFWAEDRRSKGRPISRKKFYLDDFNEIQFLKNCWLNISGGLGPR